jgi:hypothetical protein
MDNKNNKPIDKFFWNFINSYDSAQWKGGILPQDETKVGTEAKSNQFFKDIPNSPNVIPYLSSNLDFLHKGLDKLDIKIDKGLDKLDIKIGTSNDKVTSEFRTLCGILFAFLLCIAGWVFYINK